MDLKKFYITQRNVPLTWILAGLFLSARFSRNTVVVLRLTFCTLKHTQLTCTSCQQLVSLTRCFFSLRVRQSLRLVRSEDLVAASETLHKMLTYLQYESIESGKVRRIKSFIGRESSANSDGCENFAIVRCADVPHAKYPILVSVKRLSSISSLSNALC
jgi:hypothetical protein